MQAAMRQYVTAGVALLGAGAIAATPITPTALVQANLEQAVRLAATSIANIPANLAITVANTPANEVAAMNAFADSLFMTGSWWVYTPSNVLGTDQADPPKLKSLAAMALPFGPGDQTIGQVLGDQLNIVQEAELPMDAGCTAIPGGCSDPNALLSNMFRVPLSELMAGYSFGTVINPTDGQPVPWSNTTVRLDPLAPITTFANNLMQTPGNVKTVGATDVVNAGNRVLQGLWVDFYPFVPGSEIFNPDMTYLAYLFRPLAPVLCGCDEPFMAPTFGTATSPVWSATVAPASPTTVPALDPAPGASTVTLDTNPVPSRAVSRNTGPAQDVQAAAVQAVDTAARPARSKALGSASPAGVTNAVRTVRDAVTSGMSGLTGPVKTSMKAGSTADAAATPTTKGEVAAGTGTDRS